jgi:hypothetical protein
MINRYPQWAARMAAILCIISLLASSLLTPLPAYAQDRVLYEDPVGLFTLLLPEEVVVTDMIGGDEVRGLVDGLVDGIAYNLAPAGTDESIAVVIFFEFDTALQSAAGWESRRDDLLFEIGGSDFDFPDVAEAGEDDGRYFYRTGLVIDDILNLIMEGEDELVAMVLIQGASYSQTFTWDAAAVRRVLQSTGASPSPASAKQPVLTAHEDPNGIFRLQLPEDMAWSMEASPVDLANGYQLTLQRLDGALEIWLAAFPAEAVVSQMQGEPPTFTSLSGEYWQQLIEEYIESERLEAVEMEVLAGSSAMHSTLLQGNDPYGALRTVLLEEVDGVVVIASIYEQLKPTDHWQAILPTISWSPAAAKSLFLAELDPAAVPAATAVAYVDPLQAFTVALPPFLSFDTLFVGDQRLFYNFYDRQSEAALLLQVADLGEPVPAEEWEAMVDETLSWVSTWVQGDSRRPPRILAENIDRDSNFATLELSSSQTHALVKILETDGIFAVAVAYTTRERWTDEEDALRHALETLTWDGDVVLANLEDQARPPATFVESSLLLSSDLLPGETAQAGSAPRVRPVEFKAQFQEQELPGPYTLILRRGDELLGQLSAQWSLFADDSLEASVLLSIEDGAQVRMTYWPTEPLPASDEYTAELYYGDALLAIYAFQVAGEPTESPTLANLYTATDSEAAGQITRNRRYFTPSEPVTVELYGAYPAGSQLRLYWYGPTGLLAGATESRYKALDSGFQVDRFRFAPPAAWESGAYRIDVQVDGVVIKSTDFTVIDPAPISTDRPDDTQWLEALPMPPGAETLSAPDDNQIIVQLPQDDLAGSLADVEDQWDAWLRAQGWRLAPDVVTVDGTAEDGTAEDGADDNRTFVYQSHYTLAGARLLIAYQESSTARSEGHRYLITLYGPGSPDRPAASTFAAINLQNLEQLDEITQRTSSAGEYTGAYFVAGGSQIVALDSTGALTRFDRATMRELEIKRAMQGNYHRLAVSAGGDHVAAAILDFPEIGPAASPIHVWSTGNWRTPVVLGGHSGFITAIALSPDGSLLASAAGDNSIRIWSLLDGTVQLWDNSEGTDSNVNATTALAFTPGGDQLLALYSDGQAVMWDVATGTSQYNFAIGGNGLTGVLMFPEPAAEPVSSQLANPLIGVADIDFYYWRYDEQGAEPYGGLLAIDGTRIVDTALLAGGEIMVFAGDLVSFYDSAGDGYPHTLTVEEVAIQAVDAAADDEALLLLDSQGVLRLWAIAD